jgi:dTDP-4-amino-4,6-dideoxygalactose transaminase
MITNKSPIPLLDLKAQYQTIRPEIDAAIQRVLDSQYFILGPEVKALEREIASYSNCKFGIGVSSGTDALLVSLMAINTQPGDEVITTPYSFFATVGSIVRLGANPVFVDINPTTFNIDPKQIDSTITSRTRAIIPVHLFGQMADMDPLMELAEKRGLYVIEDAAQAIGAEYKGRRAGSIGHLGCFSFFPSKNLGAFGDGGMVTTNDDELAERIILLRNHGAQPKYHHRSVGGNFRLDALQAAVLRVKLNYLDQWTAARQLNASRYYELFGQVDLNESFVRLPSDAGYGRHIYNQFVIRSKNRDQLKSFLQSNNIGSAIYYPIPLHVQKCFKDLGFKWGDFPASELAAEESLALPIYPELTQKMQEQIVHTITDYFGQL